ncbi:MAG TPA: XdhC family protein, partial [Marmoricola sp.]|nr:XdhC family protein [Marmoricola sp.]
MAHRMSARVTELTSARVPFVHATVVRSQEPSSARPGDDAVVLGDGRIEGFVGGQCAEESVRAAALDSLATGESLLL